MIRLHQVSKRFGDSEAVKPVSLTVKQGEIYGVIGASGAGKSTLLRLMNVLEMPDQGRVEVNGQDLTSLKGRKLRDARKSIGMIFQHFNLVANKTVYDNIAVSLQLAGYPGKERRKRVIECLQFVGLESYISKYPAQLSGGQKQRVAIARALANHPDVLLCDEPTSSLDPNTTAEVLRVLEDINKRLGVTIVIVSHQMGVIKSLCNTVTVMADGGIYETISQKPAGVRDVDHNPQYFVDQLVQDGETGP
ncbi:methionine ABC transporter ATP-binding protein [Alteribacter natronophilus]|uniref:methionine ABC transporter ATP-binding protein n=1 Tax=Alteribacter natronophilus TaxID=2583810 RepID=UPI00110DF42F|nr:ATP-binding cassette domain-containing protein [Alteribacter natronophilus]TMW70062.1 ATP-binding cassette domain-containing protein [Alteribacter natronophilus]